MTDHRIEDINISAVKRLITPDELKRRLPNTAGVVNSVIRNRAIVRDILDRKDKRLLIVIGPCSIHEPEAAIDYGKRLKALADEVSDTLYLVMRVYFEKPRTTIGWKGLINDPHLDGSCDIETGLRMARRLLLDITELGAAAGHRGSRPYFPAVHCDLISWSAIGARTTESQTHA